MSVRLLSLRIISKCLQRNMATKAYQFKNIQPFNLAYRNCQNTIISNLTLRKISTTSENKAEDEEEGEKTDEETSIKPKEYTQEEIQAVFDGNVVRDVPKKGTQARTVPVETSVKYLESEAYTETYGEDPVWKQYRRNHKGGRPRILTRKTCIRKGQISTGNPCPICRDDFLLVDYRNVKLLNQFISEFSGQVISFSKTGICMNQHKNILTAIHKAKDHGLIKYDVPFRKYNYEDYYPELKEPKFKKSAS